MEKALMRLQSLRVDTHRQLSEHFKLKVQLEEQEADNLMKLHYCRGVVGGLDEMERILLEEIGPPTISEEFEGEAMEKPDKVEIPGYEEIKDELLEYQR